MKQRIFPGGARALVAAWFVLSFAASTARAADNPAEDIIERAGVKGGLVVHLGCGNGRFTVALRASDAYVVHGLDTDAERVAESRKFIRSKVPYGPVSVDMFDGKRLPYVDNLVNLLVADKLDDVTMDEVMRVLAPLGVAYVGGEKTVKPWPQEIDEWTHFLHGADNNAVAKDTVVGPPARIQWVSGPMWSRNHEYSPTIYGGVSSAGRLFYVQDEGPIGFVDKRFPDKKSLVARDAFNGTLLWKRPMKSWYTSRNNWRSVPVAMQRRFVAKDDKLYVTLGIGEPVSALDGATGENVMTYKGTEGAAEIVYAHGVLLVAGSPTTQAGEAGRGRGIVAVDASSGDILWTKEGTATPFSLGSSGDRAFAVIDQKLVCLELNSGKQLWQTPELALSGQTPVIAQEEFIVVAGKGQVIALSAQSGKVLWTQDDKTSTQMRGTLAAFVSPRDAFVIDGLIWLGLSGEGLDPLSGESRRSIDVAATPGHHHRCHMRKATSRYILGSKRGIEFLDVTGNSPAALYDWTRGSCRVGVVPCNGLIYLPPNACRCYIEAQMHGFYAMASDPVPRRDDAIRLDPDRLQAGPAFSNAPGPDARPEDWPSYRSDARRSGSTNTRLPRDLTQAWRVKYDDQVSPPIFVCDRVYLAAGESHSVVCLHASDGTLLWRFTAGGRIDTPPTYYKGTLLFGAADGWLYSVDASNGKLRWRFSCAPLDRRIGAFGQLESVWRAHGSVLIQDDVAYLAAGRSSLVDAGIYVYALDPLRGELLHKTHVVDSPEAGGVGSIGTAFTMPGVQSDVLVSDGTHICMRQATFDAALQRQEDTFIRTEHIGYVRRVGLRLYASSGFTDGAMNNRAYWLMGANYGNLLAFDDTATYGVKMYRKRNPPQSRTLYSLQFTPASDGYMLYRAPNQRMEKAIRETNTGKHFNGPEAFFVGMNEDHTWSRNLPVRVKAMALTQDHLVIAGPPDVIDPDDPLAAFEGRQGGVLQVLAKTSGEQLTALQLESPPVFDGVSAAAGRVLVASEDGSVTCFAGSKGNEK